MSKSIAPITKEEIQHPLTFNYIPEMLPENIGQRPMADGGLLTYGETPTDEKKQDTGVNLELLERINTLETKAGLNVQQPIGNGDESIGTDQDIEPQTFAGFLSGLNTLFSEVPFGLAQIVSGTISHAQQAAETDVASETEGVTKGHDPSLTGFSGLVGMHSKSDEDLQADYQAAVDEAENEAAIDALGTTTSVQGTPGISVSVPSGLASGPEADFGAGVGTGAGTGTGTGDVSAEGSGGEYSGGEASGGLIKGYQEGAMVEEQADTTMDTTGLGPMGLVDDMDGDQVTGVEDDLNLDTEEGAYVLNADAVELVGLKDLNQLVKDAIDIAIESDIPLPKTVDPTKKVPIKISNGEYVIPAILVPIIGLENLEKMNKRGLEYREKNKEEAPPQEAQQQDVPVEPSEVPSRGVPGEINLAQGGALADQMDRLM